MYDEILYPTDGSDGAAAALEHAREIATLCDARIHVLYVVDTRYEYGVAGEGPETESGTHVDSGSGSDGAMSDEPGLGGKPEDDGSGSGDDAASDEPGLGGDPEDDGPGIGGIPEPSEVHDALTKRGESLLEGVAAQLSGLTVIEAVRAGNPHEEILDYVGENDIDLVVMGTRGRSEVNRYLLGSVTEKVVRLSDVPVTTVRVAAD